MLGFCEGPVVQVEALQVVGKQVGQGEGGHLSNWICILIMDQHADHDRAMIWQFSSFPCANENHYLKDTIPDMQKAKKAQVKFLKKIAQRNT